MMVKLPGESLAVVEGMWSKDDSSKERTTSESAAIAQLVAQSEGERREGEASSSSGYRQADDQCAYDRQGNVIDWVREHDRQRDSDKACEKPVLTKGPHADRPLTDGSSDKDITMKIKGNSH